MSNTKTVMSQAANTQGIPLDITDVFSTYLYTGNGSTQTITNGIDLAGEGGMLWFKCRSSARDHAIYDTERPANGSGYRSRLSSNDTDAAQFFGNEFDDFTSSGFSLSGTGLVVNSSGATYASWAFRKAPKFFDVVTWTGTGSTQTIAHNLGSVPGMVMVKRTDASTIWPVYHTGVNGGTNPENYILYINGTAAQIDTNAYWNDTAPTDSVFTIGTSTNVNASGGTYVAYLFAHNDGDGGFGPSGDQDIIKCGSFTSGGSGEVEVDLGFEPQWILIKGSDIAQDWTIVDNMRGWAVGNNQAVLYPNNSNTETASSQNLVNITSTGFKNYLTYLGAGNSYIYMAIRRGPLAPPESATEVFETKTYSGTGAAQTLTTSLNGSDMALTANRSNSGALNPGAYDRLRGDEYLQTSNTSTSIASDSYGISVLSNKQNTVDVGNFASASGQTYVGQIFKRAPGFFDVVAYTGAGLGAIPHNLGVVPEMIWHKKRQNDTGSWYVYHSSFSDNQYMQLESNGAKLTATSFYTTAPNKTHFNVGGGNDMTGGGDTFISYLFASLSGISKVGSYTGNGGASQDIDCGFTSGARFVMVKAASGTGDWWIWDTERGITAGNDSSMRLNTTDAEVTTLDFIDPLSSGFTVVGSDSSRNGSGIEYIFYAIA
jgi:hypothetical protein